MAFEAIDALRKAIGRFEGDFRTFATGHFREKLLFFQQTGRGLGPPAFYRHEEVASPPGISHGVNDLITGDLGDAFEGAEAGDPTPVDLSDGLSCRDSHAGTVVRSGAGPDDDGGKSFSFGQSSKETLQRCEEVAFLGSLA